MKKIIYIRGEQGTGKTILAEVFASMAYNRIFITLTKEKSLIKILKMTTRVLIIDQFDYKDENDIKELINVSIKGKKRIILLSQFMPHEKLKPFIIELETKRVL